MNSMSTDTSKKILVVDDEDEMRLALETTLQREGYQVVTAENGHQGLDKFENDEFDLIVTDMKMPKMDGLELLRKIKERSPKTGVIMITAYGDIDNAVETMKKGAFDYLLKPFSADILTSTVKRVFLNPPGPPSPARSSGEPKKKTSFEEREIITQNKEMTELLRFVENIAYSKSTVLIIGETGTGKEMFARYIHQCSPRADQPFLAVNCAALPEGLLETELFGHEKGAFTGASYRKQGKFELASWGTLLLDEVTELSIPLQAKLLRVLQEHEIDKVGGKEPIPVDVRVIATTNRDIKKRIKDNQFREDLYYRLNVIPLKLLALRDRKDDIPALVQHFLDKHGQNEKKHITAADQETLALLKKYRWPGNVRELENMIERAVLMCHGDTLHPSHLFFDEECQEGEESETGATPKLQGTIYQMERELILQTLDEVGGNKTKAAECLGISIRTLRNKLTEYKTR